MVQAINGQRGTIRTTQEEWQDNPLAKLATITSEVIIVKDSLTYQSSKWCNHTERDYKFPIQRRLTNNECVLDYDDVDEVAKVTICMLLMSKGFKFIAWDSSVNGLHIHFWSNINDPKIKVLLTNRIADKIQTTLNYKNDIKPMQHGVIRCEHSLHPRKAIQKTLRVVNIDGDYYNEVDKNLLFSLLNIRPENVQIDSNTKPKENCVHGCVEALENANLSDGRQRALFALISYYKATYDNLQVESKVVKWMYNQKMSVQRGTVRSMIKSNSGRVGCRYRHELLEELGIAYTCR